MIAGAASSTVTEAAHAAMQALAAEPGQPAGTAVDGLVAGVLAVAAVRAEVLLGAIVVLLGGTGEGSRFIDGRARQPGLEAPRPRGFVDDAAIPETARVAAPGLPGALAVAHAGRGERTLLELAKLAVASSPNTEKTRVESILEFGRAGTTFLRSGAIHDALLAGTARSVGGLLTAADLDAVRPEVVATRAIDVGVRSWAFAPWLDLDARDSEDDDEETPALEIVAVVDGRGAFAIAAIAVGGASVALPDVGLAAPLLAEPVRRGVTRASPRSPRPMHAPIGIARLRERGRTDFGGVDLALGVGGITGKTSSFLDLVRASSAPGATIDEALRAAPASARGVFFDGRSARAIKS